MSSSAPTARPATTSPAPAARCPGALRPDLNGVSEKHIYEAMLTGPQQMPVFSDEVLTPEDKRQIIAYLKKNEETPNYGGFTLGSLGPGLRGPVRLARRHRASRGRRRLDRVPTPPARRKKSPTMSDKHELSPVEAEPIADPGLPEHEPRPTDVDEQAEKRAERQVATLFGLSTIFTMLFCVSYFVFEVGDNPRRHPRARRLQRRPRRDPRPGPAVHRHRHDPVGAQADGRPGDHRVPPPRGSTDEDREETLAMLWPRAPRSRASAGAR